MNNADELSSLYSFHDHAPMLAQEHDIRPSAVEKKACAGVERRHSFVIRATVTALGVCDDKHNDPVDCYIRNDTIQGESSDFIVFLALVLEGNAVRRHCCFGFWATLPLSLSRRYSLRFSPFLPVGVMCWLFPQFLRNRPSCFQ